MGLTQSCLQFDWTKGKAEPKPLTIQQNPTQLIRLNIIWTWVQGWVSRSCEDVYWEFTHLHIYNYMSLYTPISFPLPQLCILFHFLHTFPLCFYHLPPLTQISLSSHLPSPDLLSPHLWTFSLPYRSSAPPSVSLPSLRSFKATSLCSSSSSTHQRSPLFFSDSA